MLLKVLFKNFRSSLKDYLLFFIHQSLMVVIFFVMTLFFRIAFKVSEMDQFNKNKKLSFTIFSLNFLIFYLMGSITASYGTLINAEDQESYPYDIVAISEVKMDENIINESGITAFETVPILPVYDSNDNREPHYWGISLNNYYKLTGKEEALGGNEIILVSQQEGAQNSATAAATTVMKRALTIAGSSSNYQIQK